MPFICRCGSQLGFEKCRLIGHENRSQKTCLWAQLVDLVVGHVKKSSIMKIHGRLNTTSARGPLFINSESTLRRLIKFSPTHTQKTRCRIV